MTGIDYKDVKDNLPDKLSDLIEVALADLEKAENTEGQEINMTAWVYVTDKDAQLCSLCLAGSVMAHSLGIVLHNSVSPESFAPSIKQKLYAIDEVRKGQINNAIRRINRANNDGYYIESSRNDAPINVFKNVSIVYYEESSEKWKAQMRHFIDELRMSNL